MGVEVIERSFQKMGARVRISNLEPIRQRSRPFGELSHERNVMPFNINVLRDKKGEYFDLAVDHSVKDFKLNVLNLSAEDRHMLLYASVPQYNRIGQEVDKIGARVLVGHDERHWFAAGINSAVSTVADAKRSLKPVEVLEKEHGIRVKERNKRHNAVRLRQGEWFFVAAPSFKLDRFTLVLKNEPLSRGRGSKPHVCQEIVRGGGETVMVRGSDIITVSAWEQLPADKQRGYQRMTRNADVHARGTVRHSDHATIVLDGWHKVYMNRESNLLGAVTFLD